MIVLIKNLADYEASLIILFACKWKGLFIN